MCVERRSLTRKHISLLTGLQIIDCYTVYAASAVAANTFLRSIVAAGFSMAAAPMYHTLVRSIYCSVDILLTSLLAWAYPGRAHFSALSLWL